MKRTASILLSTLVLFGLSTTTVKAESVTYDEIEVKENMEKIGSSQKNIENVLKKLENGETLDSVKNQEEITLDIDIEDLSVSKYGVLDTNKLEEKYEKIVHYEDGSFQKLSLDIENTQTTSGISMLSSNGAVIKFTPSLYNGVINAGYDAHIFINNDSRTRSYIDRLSMNRLNVLGGSYTNRKLETVRKYEDKRNNLSAKARLSWDATVFGDISSGYGHLTIEAGDHIGGQYGVKVSSRPFGVTTQ